MGLLWRFVVKLYFVKGAVQANGMFVSISDCWQLYGGCPWLTVSQSNEPFSKGARHLCRLNVIFT